MEDTKGGDSCPKLLDLMVPKERDWMMRESEGGGKTGSGVQEEKKLELKLKLGPPGLEESSAIPLGYVPKASKTTKRGFLETVQSKNEGCPPHAATVNAAGANRNSSQPGNTSAPVVGWPPIRSFRKNLASTSKQPVAVREHSENLTKPAVCKKGLFVKINMDGIPIGRKVDLKAHDSYEKLSSVVEELFQGLLAAQKDPASVGAQVSAEENKVFTGLLDGSGEYTLVYEDSEGDMMLVGDVPWEMFVSTAKRLRVLKSSELSTLALGAASRKRTANKSRVE